LDDPALLVESEEKLLEIIRQWKSGIEQKGLGVYMGNTKELKCNIRVIR